MTDDEIFPELRIKTLPTVLAALRQPGSVTTAGCVLSRGRANRSFSLPTSEAAQA
jgi:hypothetical protein